MQTRNDAELLREYANNKSEAAFDEIARRYANLVYSAALRQTGDVEQARDVAQMVFSDLARKAGSLAGRTLLAGWLYKGVRLQSLEQRRNDHRRTRRERQAMESVDSSQEPISDWAAIRPVLDNAIASLGEEERDALLLRFFKNESLASVGAALGVSEDAAQKRVSRALEKLREILAQRGITTPAAALSATLSAHAVETMPGGLSSLLTAKALAGAALETPNRLAILKLLNLSKMKAAIAVLALAGGLVVLMVMHNRALGRLDDLRIALGKEADEAASLRADNERLASSLAEANRVRNHSNDNAQVLEIARLRDEVARLRAEATRLGSVAQAPSTITNLHPKPPPQIQFKASFITIPAYGPDYGGSGPGLLTTDQTAAIQEVGRATAGANYISFPWIITLCGRQAHFSSIPNIPTSDGSTNVGLSLDVLSECSTDTNLISFWMLLQSSRLGDQSNIEQLTITNSFSVTSGNTLMLTRRLPGIGPWFSGDSTNFQGARDLEVFITPMLIDAAGNPLFKADNTNPSLGETLSNPSGIFPNNGPSNGGPAPETAPPQ